MEISFEITEEDYVNFNLYHIENSPSQKKTYTLLRYAIPVLFSFPIYFIGTGLFNQPSGYWLTVALLFAAGWILFFPKINKNTIKQQAKKLLSEGDNSSIFGRKTMVIEENTITISEQDSTSVIAKNTIKEIKVYDDMILLYVSSVSAEIIPTRHLDLETKKQLLDELDK